VFLIVVGGAIDFQAQFQEDKGRNEDGLRVFRASLAGSSALFTLGGASLGGLGAGAFCAATFTISCGGPVGTAVVIGGGMVIGGFAGDQTHELIVEGWVLK